MSDRKRITAWVTKYALSDGVRRAEVEVVGDGMVKHRVPGAFDTYLHGEGREWHREWVSAVAKARAMRDSKIASLKKQLAKLQALDWPDEPPTT